MVTMKNIKNTFEKWAGCRKVYMKNERSDETMSNNKNMQKQE